MADKRPRCVSHSERECFDDCRAKWHLWYVAGRRPRRSHPGRRLGVLFEAAFAARLRAWARDLGAPLGPGPRRVRRGDEVRIEDGPPQVDPAEAIREACAAEEWPWHERYGSTEDAAELALALADRAYLAMGFPSGRWRPVVVAGAAVVQARLSAPLPFAPGSFAATYYPGGAAGLLDLCAEDGERGWRPVLVDTKVRGDLSSSPDLGCDPQLGLYQHLLRSNGVRVHLCEQWEVLGHLPVEPPALKTGKGISRDKEHRATRETFLAACRRHGVDPRQYADHLEGLDRRAWWQATPGGGTDAEVDDLVRELAAVADLMACLALTPAGEWPSGSPATRNLRTFAGSPCHRCDSQADCWSLRAQGRPLSDLAAGTAAAPAEVADLADLARHERADLRAKET